jgi:hypothetical protein
MDNNSEMAVVVCTEHKGVFFGYTSSPKCPHVILKRARMCVRFVNTRGVLGLAAKGPVEGCKISDAVPSIELPDVHCVMEASPAAVEAWERGVWTA